MSTEVRSAQTGERAIEFLEYLVTVGFADERHELR